jgi:hypothetical protein
MVYICIYTFIILVYILIYTVAYIMFYYMAYILIYTLFGIQKISSTTRPISPSKPEDIKPEDHSKKPLFVVDKDSNTCINEFFFYVFSHVGRLQCLRELSVASLDQAVSLSTAGYCSNLKTTSGPGLGASPVISKKTVAYFESFLGAAPFPRILKDPRLHARVDKFNANTMKCLSKVSDKDFVR